MDMSFGHYVRVLVDMDVFREIKYKILVERQGNTLFTKIEYEKFPHFCTLCKIVGHSLDICKFAKKCDEDLEINEHAERHTKKNYFPKGRNSERGKELEELAKELLPTDKQPVERLETSRKNTNKVKLALHEDTQLDQTHIYVARTFETQVFQTPDLEHRVTENAGLETVQVSGSGNVRNQGDTHE